MNKQALVLLHGWGFNHYIWQSILPKLSRHYDIIALDLPGYASAQDQLISTDMSIVIQQILAQTPKQAIYCGWSLGGTIAMALTLSAPQRVLQLITLASTPRFLKDTNWPGMNEDVLDDFANELLATPMAALKRFFYAQFQQTRVDRHAIIQPVLAAGIAQQETLHCGLELLRHTDLRPTLAQINCPQLHIFGGLDRLIPKKITRAITNYAANARIKLIDHAAHIPFLTHTDQCLQHMTEFTYDNH